MATTLGERWLTQESAHLSQVQGPVFDSHHPCLKKKKSVILVHACHLSVSGIEMGGFLGLASLLA